MADPYGYLNYNPLQGTPWTVNMGAQAASNAANAGNNNWWNGLLGGGAGGMLGGLSSLGSLATGIMQGLAGFQQMGLANRALSLAKQQFGFQKALANRNLANQAKIINNTYDNAAQVAAGMIGGKDSSGRYGFTSPTLVADYANRAKQQHVDGSAIG